MNSNERKIVDVLKELREEYGLAAIKTEFELEGVRLEEVCRLKEVTMRAGVGVTLKIGGCEAITDMKMGRIVGVDTVVAPMIESAFAAKKFVRSALNTFPEDELVDTKLFINIETITGYNNFDEIIASSDFDKLAGVVIGRGDMSGSMGKGYEYMESDELIEMSNSLFARAKQKRSDCVCILGGVPGPQSFKFLSSINAGLVDEYESQKLVFHSSGVYGEKESEGFMKGLYFEYLWTLNKREYYMQLASEGDRKIKSLEKFFA